LRNDHYRGGGDGADSASFALAGRAAFGAVVELDRRTAGGDDCFGWGRVDAEVGSSGVHCRSGGGATGIFDPVGSFRVDEFAAATDDVEPRFGRGFGVCRGVARNAARIVTGRGRIICKLRVSNVKRV
jgi:hypothetical protein